MMFNVVLTLHVLVCVALIAIVLVQRGRGAGLIESAAGAENLFGTKTAGFFVKATTVLAVLFFVLSIALTVLSKHRGKSIIESMPVPAAVKVTAAKEETKPEAVKVDAQATTPEVVPETSPASPASVEAASAAK
jgi:preprotein translocase subunit SecG